jgi:hypothetical protein
MHSRISCIAGSVLLLLACVALPAGELVGSKLPGRWVAGEFAQIHTRCMLAYQCIPGRSILHGPETVVKTTASESSFGVCNAAGGPADGCNSCSASPPTKPCEYWLEKR